MTAVAEDRMREAEEAPARVAGKGRGPRESLLGRTGATLVMLVFTLYFLTPIWWLVVSSTKTLGNFNSTFSLWFSPTSLQDAVANLGGLFAFGDGIYLRWLVNSVGYALVAGAIGTLLAAMCGYALAKYRFPGREVLFNVVLGGVLVCRRRPSRCRSS